MSAVDTSNEAVERLAAMWERSSWAGGGFTHTRAAMLLRALATRMGAKWHHGAHRHNGHYSLILGEQP